MASRQNTETVLSQGRKKCAKTTSVTALTYAVENSLNANSFARWTRVLTIMLARRAFLSIIRYLHERSDYSMEQGASGMSTYPVIPKQLTWVMDKCVHEPENANAASPTKRCNGCGPASTAFALGVSTEFSITTNYNTVFYEQVQCVNRSEYSDDGVKYIFINERLYHVIAIDYQSRAANSLNREKVTVDALYNDVESYQDQMQISEPFGIKNKQIRFNYLYDSDGKFYVPLYADYLNKDNLRGENIIAILVVYTDGQSTPGDSSDFSDKAKRGKIEEGIFKIMERVTNKCRINSMELLYMKQYEYLSALNQALNTFDYLSAHAPVEIADELFTRISSEFGLEKCVLFLPDSLSETLSDMAYSARVYASGRYINDSGYSLKVSEIDQRAIIGGKISISEIRNMNVLIGFEFSDNDNAYDFYIQRHEMSGHNNDEHEEFIAVALLLYWKEPFAPYGLSDDGTQHDPVFNSLIQTICSSLLAGAAINKQLVLNVLQETTQHDLAQKLETITMQDNDYEARLRTYHFDSGWQSEEDFYNASLSYQSYVGRLISHIRFFERGLSQPNLNQEPEIKEFNLYTDLLYDIHQLYSFEHAGRHVFVVLKPRQRLQNRLTTIYADINMLERIIVNLLDNAFKYAYEYSNVYLDYYTESDNAVVDIISYNSGIPDCSDDSGGRIRDRIFDRGYRYSSEKKKKAGQGIGLYTARNFARKHIVGARTGDVVLIEDELISEFHVPALEEAISRNILSEDDAGYTTAKKEYTKLELPTKNIVAVENKRRSLLSDVNVKPPNPNDSDTYLGMRKRKGFRFDKNFYRIMMYNKKTYRVTFRVTIPQPNSK